MDALPQQFVERFKEILPDNHQQEVLRCFCFPRPLSVRINTLKISVKDALGILRDRKIGFQQVPWALETVLVLSPLDSGEGLEDLMAKGAAYMQGLSSLLPVLALDPKPGEHVLDLCAAPGSKTTQIAAWMQNHGRITAVENIKKRYYKLRSVCSLLGAEIVDLKLMDGRRFRSAQLFDKVLVDAPCSSEGRFKMFDKKTRAYWSIRKIREMKRKQKGLLLNAGRMLKSGGTLVYSTCTFAPEENESVVSWFLKKTQNRFFVEKFLIKGVKSYPAVLEWNGKSFDPQVRNCFRVLPTKDMEGFFVAKLIRQ